KWDCTMKFDELKVEQLKKKLAKLDLPTAGNKVELQKRLMEEFKRLGQDIDSHDFDEKDELQMSVRTLQAAWT
ncbi:hypothetical protein EVAR_71250_1, partial [Eumeta japonica]